MKKQNHFGRTVRLAVIGVGLCLAAGMARAAQLVTFTRGQSIVVQSVEMRGGWYYFVLDGGGEMGVPVKQVASVEEYEAPPPSANPPAVTAPPVAPPPAQAVSQPTAQAGLPQPDHQVPAPQAAVPGTEPPAPQPNVAAQGNDDWRYKVRMSGGPRQGMQNPFGAAGPGARGGGRLPMGVGKPGSQRPYPPQPQTPQN